MQTTLIAVILGGASGYVAPIRVVALVRFRRDRHLVRSDARSRALTRFRRRTLVTRDDR